MANCSIPNSTPAIGRTSTPLSRRSRSQNSVFATFFTAFGLTKSIRSQTLSFSNVQHSTSNTQRPIRAVGCWTLGVRRWAFSASWRVKGAWWSSRSSKPLSVPHTRDRGRFDSYPLRFSFVIILNGAKRSRRTPWPFPKAIQGFLDFARNDRDRKEVSIYVA